MPLRLLLNGYKGRMGQTIQAMAAECDAEITSRLDVGDAMASAAFEEVDVVMDFSSHEATWPLAQLAARHNVPMVIGTTGHTPAERQGILGLASKIPMVWSGNYSVGVNLLNFLVRRAASVLDLHYDAEIVEMHHRDKKDSPSGTAEKLLQIVRETRGVRADAVVYGRHGIVGPRPEGQIGVHALRGGDVVGDHTVIFAGDGERIELTHKASTRAIFARGALRAAQWARGRQPGLYGMEDVLELNG